MDSTSQNKKINEPMPEYIKTFLEKMRSIPDTPEGNMEISRMVSQSLEECDAKALEKMEALDLAKKSAKEKEKIMET